MVHKATEELIQTTAKRLFAINGYDGVSMRILAKESGVGLSSIYHFFEDKDVLLESIYKKTNRQLGEFRARLPEQPTAREQLAQLIEFQFKHTEDVVFIIKYYLHFRVDFAALPTKTLPVKSTLHVEEVINMGIRTGECLVSDDQIANKSRVIAHTINGYLLEYYPAVPSEDERKQIIDDVVSFSLLGLGKH